jgi:hypothetical protein
MVLFPIFLGFFVVSVHMQQQFQRAAALMCACERKRQKNPKKWGTEPFLVGLFVGDTRDTIKHKTA